MIEETVTRLGNDIADVAYKLSILEEEIAKLNAHIIELLDKERKDA
jgi:hypothetical protein